MAIIMDQGPCCVRHHNRPKTYLRYSLVLHDFNGRSINARYTSTNVLFVPSLAGLLELCSAVLVLRNSVELLDPLSVPQ